jgi:hypothetical protein
MRSCQKTWRPIPLRFDFLAMKEPFRRQPRFRINDRVRIVGPSAHSQPHNSGTVTEVLESRTNAIIRYRVTFSDATTDTFFGFELELVQP